MQHICRYTIWMPVTARLSYIFYPTLNKCGSNLVRHGICIFGVEDLWHLNASRFIIGNKFYPELDFEAVSCWLQWIFRLTHSANSRSLDLNYYQELPHVRFNRDIKRYRHNLSDFNCTFKYSATQVKKKNKYMKKNYFNCLLSDKKL